MSFSIRFESAGNGTPEDRERVRQGLTETLRIPAATVEQMLTHAPVTVKSGLSEEQARQFALALESVGAVVSVIAPPATPSAASPTPADTAPEPHWWERLTVYSPPFDPTAPPVMTMTAATCRAQGQSLFLGHPQLATVDIADIRLVSVFKIEDGRWFIDLYCRHQVRPVRMNAENVDFASFNLSTPLQPAAAITAFLEFILVRSPQTLIDLTTFRFLRNPESVRLFPELRAAETYQARLTADVMANSIDAVNRSFLTGKEAELYRDLEDPWSRPIDPPAAAAPAGFQPPPESFFTTKTQYPPPVAPPQPYFQPPPAAPYPPPPGPPPAYPPTYPQYSSPPAMPPVYPPAHPQYPVPPEMPPSPFPQPGFAPPRFVPPPLQSPPGAPNYWSDATASISLLPQICLFVQLGILGVSLMAELSQGTKFKNLTGLLLARGMTVAFYLLTLYFIRTADRKAAIAFIAALFFEIFILLLGGYVFTLIAGVIVGLIVFAWVIRETLE